MAYMSYCRFEGTRHEFSICLNEVQEHIDEAAEYEVSGHEIEHFKNMVQNFVWFLQDNLLLDEEGNLNEEELESICEKMAKSFDGEDYE